MALKLVLDTNTVLYLLGGRLDEPLPEGRYFASVITEMELLSYPSLDVAEEKHVREFLAEIILIGLTREVKETAIRLRRRHLLKLPDAIIAATALTLEAKLSANDRKLLRIPELDFIRPSLREA